MAFRPTNGRSIGLALLEDTAALRWRDPWRLSWVVLTWIPSPTFVAPQSPPDSDTSTE